MVPIAPGKFVILVGVAFMPLCSAECKEGKWAECRAELIQAVFNQSTVPARAPDYILPGGGPQVWKGEDKAYIMSGLPGPGRGTQVGDVSWANNLTALIWTIESPFIKLNTTVFHSLNTSSRAPANYNPPPYGKGQGPGGPGPNDPWGQSDDYAPHGYGDTLIIYHNGHETNSCTPNFDGVVDYFNELGYDVMEMMMPLIGCNQAYQYGNPRSHAWFQQWEDKGDHTMRFFIEPVAHAASYAKSLGYKHIVMVGLSGGGWTTTVASSMVTDIELSFPTAGSVPKWPTAAYPKWVPDLPEGRNKDAKSPDIFNPAPLVGAGGDYEQQQARPMFKAVGGYLQMYILAALEADRNQLQILHEYDSCCFRAAGLWSDIEAYNAYAQSQVGGWMQTAVTAGNYHEVNFRDKTLIAALVERLRKKGKLDRYDFRNLPFDDLNVQRNHASNAVLV